MMEISMDKLKWLLVVSFLGGVLLTVLAFAALIHYDGYPTVDGAIRRMIRWLPFCYNGVEEHGLRVYRDPCNPRFWWSVLVGVVGGFFILGIAVALWFLMRNDPEIQAEEARAQSEMAKPGYSGPAGRWRWIRKRGKDLADS
jgi:hypothetical protein